MWRRRNSEETKEGGLAVAPALGGVALVDQAWAVVVAGAPLEAWAETLGAEEDQVAHHQPAAQTTGPTWVGVEGAVGALAPGASNNQHPGSNWCFINISKHDIMDNK